MMSFSVWLPGLLFLLGGLWSHVPSEGGLFSGGLCQGEPPPPYGEVGGTHPTGMLCCLTKLCVLVVKQ